jgi:hypothetical protein
MSLRGHQMRKLKRLLLAIPIVFGAAFVGLCFTARWQHLAKLYDETSKVEVSIQGGKKEQLWRNDKQIAEFLRQEIGDSE